MLLKNTSSVISVVVFTDIRMTHSSILVPVDPLKQSLVRYTLKHQVAHNQKLHSQHLNFVSVSFWWKTHGTEFSQIA